MGALLCIPVTGMAGEVLDSSLDGDGIRIYDFGVEERPIANCPAAGGKQLLVMREGDYAISVIRLLWDGSVDPGFNAGQPVRHEGIPTFYNDSNGVSLCRTDGSMVLAARVGGTNGDFDIVVIGLGADGMLIPGFMGSPNGVGRIDLDSYRNDLRDIELPLGFNHAPGGGALLTGFVDTAGGERPFLIEFGTNAVRRVSFPEPAGFINNIRASAAGVGPGGGIWVVGWGYNNGKRAFRMYLDPETLAVVRTETGSTVGIETAGGGFVREGVMVVGAVERVPNGPALPRLLVLRTGGQFDTLELPQPEPLAPGLATGVNPFGSTVLPLPNNQVLYAIGAEAFAGSEFRGYKGWYIARAHIGNSAAEDYVDTRFGFGGHSVLSVHSGDPSCVGKLNTQYHNRIQYWGGQPAIIGTMKRICDPDGTSDAVILRLLRSDELFAHGFE